nr:hypothetical protein [Tanacetum cinerariifolium]
MSSTFADTHNMVAILNKSEAIEGFDQIINFLNGSYISYALTVNPHIYVSCIKQFWNIVTVKQSNDVIRLQALVDRKKVVLTETVIRDVLRLDDAEGVDCLPNEEIFAGLARMGYEKPSTKLTFYKAFFSSQWKFLIHTILQSMSAKHTSWNEFSSAMASAVICLVGKGCSGVETPLFKGMLVAGEPEKQGDDIQDQSISSPSPPTPPPQPPQDIPSISKVDQDLNITKLKIKVKKLERANKVKALKLRRLKKVRTSQRIESSDDIDMEDAFNHGRMIADLDRDEGIALMDNEGTEKKAEDAQVTGDEQVKGRQAEIYQIDMDHASKVLSMQEDEPEVKEEVEVVTTAKLITKVVVAVSELVTTASETTAAVHAATITAAPVRRYSVTKKRPQTEAQAQKNMIMYLKNTAGFILDYFKGMSYDEIRPIFEAKFNSNIEFLLKSKEQIEEEENRALESINETPAQKAAKRRKLNEEATPLAKKVPVVDYQIIQLNNKPRYKIIRADGTYQLYSNVWKTRWIRSSLEESKKYSWSSKERRYPLSRFTLDQLLNAKRLQVEEQSEMSLELLRKSFCKRSSVSTHPSKRLHSFCFDDDDDEDYTSAITPDKPVLSTEEPDNSLSMGHEHLDTILVTESDEFIKSGVKNLIPIPSESEGISEHVCDVPSHDNSPPLDISKDQIEDFSESNKEFSSIDDNSFFIDTIDYVEASPLDSELVSSEVMEIVIPE